MTSTHYLLGLLRLVFGWIFLWAFMDKLWGFGLGTSATKSWLAGGSPTKGFLSGSASQIFAALAGNTVIDWLFMSVLLLIGLALMLGIGLRIASIAGTALVLLMWLASLPLKQNPFVDQHIIFAFIFLLLPRLQAGRIFGLATWWRLQPFVQRFPWLQ